MIQEVRSRPSTIHAVHRQCWRQPLAPMIVMWFANQKICLSLDVFVITITGYCLRNISQNTFIEHISPRPSVLCTQEAVSCSRRHADDSRCHTRVCIVCQIPMLCCRKARLLFSCEETPTTTCVSRLSVYAIASIMKQLLIFGRERVLFL